MRTMHFTAKTRFFGEIQGNLLRKLNGGNEKVATEANLQPFCNVRGQNTDLWWMVGHIALQTMQFCGWGKVILRFVVEEASLESFKIVNVCRNVNHRQWKQCAQPLEVLLFSIIYFLLIFFCNESKGKRWMDGWGRQNATNMTSGLFAFYISAVLYTNRQNIMTTDSWF